MKKIMAGLITGCFLVGMAGIAQALSITDVGAIDAIMATATLPDSGDATELGWVDSVLGGTHEYLSKYNVEPSDWENVVGYSSSVFALELQDAPAYFLVKTGDNTGSSYTHYLFTNLDELNYAVIDLEAMGFDLRNITNIGKMSHVGEIQPIPEPATMMLFGTGLAGLAGYARRRKMKHD